MFKLLFTIQASTDLNDIANIPELIKRSKAVKKALGLLEGACGRTSKSGRSEL